ncbi:hypothetical protein HJC23_008641 [Cyclotella cryptica]|uniref:Uncharacterized protein n=1 Tax=Cyclotella cryptica TaxID=29204 RepID=A0ABD3NTP4_9STRA
MFRNHTNESTSPRRYTESSGFTTEEFEGDSWKSDSDSSEDDVRVDDAEEELSLLSSNHHDDDEHAARDESHAEENARQGRHDEEDGISSNIVGEPAGEKEEDSSTSLEDEDLEPSHPPPDELGTNANDGVGGAITNNIEMDVGKEENDPRRQPKEQQQEGAKKEKGKSTLRGSRRDMVSLPDRSLLPPNNVMGNQEEDEDLSKSTRRLDSDEEYLETSWLPINFDNHHSTGNYRSHDTDNNINSHQHQQRVEGNTTSEKQHQHQRKTRNQILKDRDGRRLIRNSSPSSKINATTTNNNMANQKKPLSPPKQRRRYCLGISLLLFCIGTASVACWFLFYYLDDVRRTPNQENNSQSQYTSSNVNQENGGAATSDETMIQPIDKPLLEDDAECAYFTVEIVTDMYGNETSWVLSYLFNRDKTVDVADANDSETQGHDHDDDADVVVYTERYISSPSRFRGTRNRLRQHNTQWQRKLSKEEPQQQQEQQQQPSASWNNSQPSQVPQELPVGNGGPYMYLGTAPSSPQPNTSSHNSTYCLTKGSYKFDLYDANGDGFCCHYGNGSYSLYFNGGGRSIVQSSQFKDERMESVEFKVTDDDIMLSTMLSTASPSFSSTFPVSSYPPSMTPFNRSSASIKRMATASWLDLQSDVSKSYGLIFDIQTNRNISSLVIAGMELLLYTTNSIHYEVWTMPGSWRELNTSESAAFSSSFSPVANGTMLGRGVCEDCGFSSIPLDDFQDVLIEGAKTVQSFWVTLASDNLVFKKHDKSQIAQSSCDSFTVNVGSAVLVYPLENVDPDLDLSGNNGFLGAIQYESMFRDIAGTPHPTPSPLNLNSTESPSISTSRSHSPASDLSVEPTYQTQNPTFLNSSATSSIPTVSNNFTTTVPTYSESLDNFTITFGNNTSKINYTISINASNPVVLNSSVAPTSVMFGNSTSFPSLPFSPSPRPSSYADAVTADDGRPILNSTLVLDDTASENNYTVPINASNLDESNSTVAPTSVMFGNPSSFSPTPGPSFNDTIVVDEGSITDNSTAEMDNTGDIGMNNTSPLSNDTDDMNSPEMTPAPSPSSNSSSVPFSSFSPSHSSSYNATAGVDKGSKNLTDSTLSNGTPPTVPGMNSTERTSASSTSAPANLTVTDK